MWAFLGVLLLATASFWGLRSLSTNQPQKPDCSKREQVTPVAVATVMQKTVPVQIKTIGTVQASSTVVVTPQANGRITEGISTWYSLRGL